WLLGTLSGSGVVYPISRQPHDEIQVKHSDGMYVPASAFSLTALNDLQKPLHPNRAKPGKPTAFYEAARGIVSFRSSWKSDATLLIFDGSQRRPGVQGHAHASSGHFSLTALGEYFAIDTGRYNNEQDQHNVVLIEGKSDESTIGRWSAVRRHGLLTDYQPGDFVDCATADSSHQYQCCWAGRTIGLVKGGHAPAYVWTVEDINHRDDWSDYWWCCNTSPENVIKTFKRKATITGWRYGNHLDVHFVLPSARGYPRPHVLTVVQDVQTTSSHRYVSDPRAEAKKFRRPSNMIHRSAFIRPRLLAKVAGYNGRFMSLMLPRLKGDKPATVKSLHCLDNSLALQITFSKVRDTIIFAYEHHLLESDGIKARGDWCVVRRSRLDGQVLAAELNGGTDLIADGVSYA
ncbi:MAG: heparinase II/III family protein, partial [Planctomycetota bacterium]|nr:heparinase II/III family protein [Planctomycetota bacterium]